MHWLAYFRLLFNEMHQGKIKYPHLKRAFRWNERQVMFFSGNWACGSAITRSWNSADILGGIFGTNWKSMKKHGHLWNWKDYGRLIVPPGVEPRPRVNPPTLSIFISTWHGKLRRQKYYPSSFQLIIILKFYFKSHHNKSRQIKQGQNPDRPFHKL